jgi:hypothetical protein
MDSRIRTIIAVAVVGVASLASGSVMAGTGIPASPPSSHGWGIAVEVPGTATLNKGGGAEISSVSCTSAGNCSAGGYYTASYRHGEAFVVNQVHGTWGTAIEVPGTAALNKGGNAEITSVSCTSAGNCGAGGYYVDSSFRYQAFVVSEVNGTWGTAIQVPGTAGFKRLWVAIINSVSCTSAGNCSAGGLYGNGPRHQQAFVVNQVHGTWHKAIEVPGTAALNRGGLAEINSVSCASAGDCGAGGSYSRGFGNYQAFVVSETNGTWHEAIEVPGTAARNGGEDAAVDSVSCASAGSCSAGGSYEDSSRNYHAFVVSEVGGTWHKAIEVPGTAALDQGGYAAITSVSCTAAGNCGAGGSYADSSGHGQVLVVSQVHGTWHKAIEVPGTAALNQGNNAAITSVSCTSAADCSAGGYYAGKFGHSRAFVVSKT